MSDKRDKLSKMVLEFVKAQPGYNPTDQEQIHTFFDNNKRYRVIYGKDEMAGILGFGSHIDEAFKEFVTSWNLMKGFEWIKKNK